MIDFIKMLVDGTSPIWLAFLIMFVLDMLFDAIDYLKK
jgi:hypothetical protein